MAVERKQIDFVFFDAGGGHRAAATALQAVISQEGRPWDVQLVNLQDVLDELDIFRKMTGIRMQDVYNLILKKGWTLGSPQMTVIMHWLIRMYHPAQVESLKKFWQKRKPDLVVSLIPNFGRALHESLRAIHAETPLVTVLTDMADYPPHFWMEPDQEQYYVCGTVKAFSQAVALGYGAERLYRASGMILHPRFYRPIPVDRQEERKKLRLDPNLPTGLILFGGQGSPVMKSILQRVEAAGAKAQFIAVCGKNQGLRDVLGSRLWKMPVFVEGFTAEVPYYMHLSDFFIGKPGPGSISEAVAMHLPVIVENNAWTLPQERYNTEWVKENEVGFVLDNFREIAPAVQRLLSGGTLEQLRDNTAKLQNMAVFEIPVFLERVMANAKVRII